MTPPHSEFILPKFQEPKAQTELNIAIAFAISHTSNSRNVEHPWYGFWKMVADGLIDGLIPDGHTKFLVFPQMHLWYAPSVKKEGQHLRHSHTRSIDTVVSATHTIPQKYTSSTYPDFAIVRLKHSKRNSGIDDSDERLKWMPWLNIRVDKGFIGVPVVFENKRGGNRTPNGILLSEDILQLAQQQCAVQAAHVFKIYNYQKSVVAIATVGHWWTYRNFKHDSDIMKKNLKEMDERDAKQLQMAKVKEGNEDEYERLRDSDFVIGSDDDFSDGEDSDEEMSNEVLPHTALQSDDIIASVEETEQHITIPDSQWSGAMEFGTPVSNQRLWRLHKHVNEVARSGNNFIRG